MVHTRKIFLISILFLSNLQPWLLSVHEQNPIKEFEFCFFLLVRICFKLPSSFCLQLHQKINFSTPFKIFYSKKKSKKTVGASISSPKAFQIFTSAGNKSEKFHIAKSVSYNHWIQSAACLGKDIVSFGLKITNENPSKIKKTGGCRVSPTGGLSSASAPFYIPQLAIYILTLTITTQMGVAGLIPIMLFFFHYFFWENSMVKFISLKKKYLNIFGTTPGFQNVKSNKSPVLGGVIIFFFGLFPQHTSRKPGVPEIFKFFFFREMNLTIEFLTLEIVVVGIMIIKFVIRDPHLCTENFHNLPEQALRLPVGCGSKVGGLCVEAPIKNIQKYISQKFPN
ncbi:putative signal peptide protein [Puccinia sorghi]|uniref:Putative signal peptide protein n=1 Tax=Puccinia sorghi TaxID=27349 RepID=A0A0L6UC22_9BASI|nr:putative signal peptide protein [Puccinia sorghi]